MNQREPGKFVNEYSWYNSRTNSGGFVPVEPMPENWHTRIGYDPEESFQDLFKRIEEGSIKVPLFPNSNSNKEDVQEIPQILE
jgi:hypothetical protein